MIPFLEWTEGQSHLPRPRHLIVGKEYDDRRYLGLAPLQCATCGVTHSHSVWIDKDAQDRSTAFAVAYCTFCRTTNNSELQIAVALAAVWKS